MARRKKKKKKKSSGSVGGRPAPAYFEGMDGKDPDGASWRPKPSLAGIVLAAREGKQLSNAAKNDTKELLDRVRADAEDAFSRLERGAGITKIYFGVDIKSAQAAWVLIPKHAWVTGDVVADLNPDLLMMEVYRQGVPAHHRRAHQRVCVKVVDKNRSLPQTNRLRTSIATYLARLAAS